MTEREKQKERRRDEILSAALDVFVRKGYAAATIKDIAASAGISVGLMFHYFESKQALLLELIELGLKGPQSVFAMQDTAEPMEFFEYAAEQIIFFISSYPFVASMFVLMYQAYISDATPSDVKAIMGQEELYRRSAELITLGQKQGTIRDGDPMALALTFWAAIQGAAEVAALFPEKPCPKSEWISDILKRR